MTAFGAAVGQGADRLGSYLAMVGREIADAEFTGDRARFCTRIAISVVLAVTLAQWARFDDVWWAGISAIMASQATRPASVQRSLVRIVGTSAGIAVGFVAIALFAYDHVALSLVLFICGTVGVAGMSLSRHGYAWLLVGLTANMVIVMAMNDPSQMPYIAFARIAGVATGCVAAVAMAIVLAPRAEAAPPAEAPGWTDLLGRNWPVVEHGIRSGITVMILPSLWNLFELPSLNQMAISVMVVMSVPVTGADAAAMGAAVLERSVQRIIGCLLGGVLSLLLLATPLTVYPLWLAVLFAGVWVGALLQTSTRGASYMGIQAAVVFVVTLVQGDGPPSSLLPGIERLAGMLSGLVVLLLIGLVLWPTSRRPEAA